MWEFNGVLYVTIKVSRNDNMRNNLWWRRNTIYVLSRISDMQLWGANLKALEQFLSYYYLITCNNIKHRLSGMCEKPNTTDLPSEDERAIGRLQKELWETTFYNLTHHSTAIVTDAPGDLSVFLSAASTQLWFSKALTLLRMAITAQDDTVLSRFLFFYWLPAIDKPETKENWAGIVARETNLKEILMQEKLFTRCLDYQWHVCVKGNGINN